MSIIQRGIRYLGVAMILAAIAGISLAEAGNFFAETPKHAPRLGRRSEEVPTKKTHSRMKYFYADIPKAMPRIGRSGSSLLSKRSEDNSCGSWLTTLLLGLHKSDTVDQAGNQCLNLQDLLQVPAIRSAFIRFNNERNWHEAEDDGDSNPSIRDVVEDESFQRWRQPTLKDILKQEG